MLICAHLTQLLVNQKYFNPVTDIDVIYQHNTLSRLAFQHQKMSITTHTSLASSTNWVRIHWRVMYSVDHHVILTGVTVWGTGVGGHGRLKMQQWELRNQTAGVENAGLGPT